MLPTITIGDFTIAMYGLLILIGFALGCLVSVFRSSKCGVPKEDVFYSILFGAIGVVIGGKILYILTILKPLIEHFSELIQSPENILGLLGGGFVFYGGLFGGIIGVYLYSKIYRIPFYPLIQVMIPAIPLIHAFGRLGCFCAGCCYGIPFDPPIGMMFQASPVAPHDITLFPVQLLEAGLNLILFFVLYYGISRVENKISLLGFYLICYGVIRFITEFFRYDAERGSWLIFSTSQWISLLVVPCGIVLMIRQYKRYKARQNIN